jgi:hypothetical protein
MKNRALYIIAMSISLLISYGAFYVVSGNYPNMIETAKGTVCAFISFTACEFLIWRFGLHFDFPFVTKRISRIMFDVLIFIRLFSVYPIMNGYEIVTVIFYLLMSIIPLIIIFKTEKKQAAETSKQGVAPVLIITSICLAFNFFINLPSFFSTIATDIHTHYLFVFVIPTIFGMMINTLCADHYIKDKQNGGSPLLTAVSLFITTTPPIFSLTLFIAFVVLIGSLFQ